LTKISIDSLPDRIEWGCISR